jgi:hypothetical protein
MRKLSKMNGCKIHPFRSEAGLPTREWNGCPTEAIYSKIRDEEAKEICEGFIFN